MLVEARDHANSQDWHRVGLYRDPDSTGAAEAYDRLSGANGRLGWVKYRVSFPVLAAAA